MAKRKDLPDQKNEGIENYYQLNTDAVNRLVNATAENSPEVGNEAENYKSGGLSKVPNWLKALFIKFWFNGAACFFFYWGFGTYIADQWALILVLGVALGIITDILVNNLLRFMQGDEKINDKWMLLPMKGFWTFFVNILYAMVVLLLVVYTYNGINALIIIWKNLPADSVPLGVEPFLFGLLYLLYDLAFIGIKDGIVSAVKRQKVVNMPTEPTVEPTQQPSSEQNKPVVVKQVMPSGSKKRKKK